LKISVVDSEMRIKPIDFLRYEGSRYEALCKDMKVKIKYQ